MNYGLQQRMLRLIAAMGALTACLVGVLAPAARGADIATLQARVESAREQARSIAATVELRNNQYQTAAASAAAAAARQAVLEEQLAEGRKRLADLRDRVGVATAKFRRVQARFDRAQGRLADRIVAMYKSDTPDIATVVLESDGFEEMLTRAAYLEHVNDADKDLVRDVKQLRDEVRSVLRQVESLKRRAALEVERLDHARGEIAAARRAAEARAAEGRRAFAAAKSSLDTLHSRISGWTRQVRALQVATGGGGDAAGEVQRWFGDFAIPNYIVQCESGGNYKALNPTSGAGGAYQFMPETYKALGGKYGLPQNAPKWEQDRLAAKLWDNGRGAGNWACA